MLRTTPCIPQSDERASFCKKLAKADGLLDFRQAAFILERQIRAFQPWPGSYFFKDGVRYKVLQAHLLNSCRSNDPIGTFTINADRTTLSIATADGALAIDCIQKACERPLPVATFLKGHPGF